MAPAHRQLPLPPDVAEIFPVELVLNPHGFLKAAALPGANPKAVWRWELGEMGRDGPEVSPERMRVVSITWGKYRVDATVNKENLLQRIHTWVPSETLGDMNYEHEFPNASYVTVDGIRFPTDWHSHQGWDDNFGTQAVTSGHNAFGGTLKDVRPNVCPDPVAVPATVASATFPMRVDVQTLADGVYLMAGGTHNSVAVEFASFIVDLRRAAERSAKPRGHRRGRPSDPQQADPFRRQLAPALRPHRRPARLQPHRRNASSRTGRTTIS